MTWHDITLYHITSHHITSHYIILYYNMHQDKHLPILVHVPPPCDQGWSGGLLKRWCYGTIFNALLREKSIPCTMTINLLRQRCRYLKTVQSCATHCGNKCCVKNHLQTPYCAYRFFVRQCCVKNRLQTPGYAFRFFVRQCCVQNCRLKSSGVTSYLMLPTFL